MVLSGSACCMRLRKKSCHGDEREGEKDTDEHSGS